MVFTLSTVEIQYLQLQIFFTAGSWFLYPAFMISLQYTAITILHGFLAASEEKRQGSCFEVLCSVYAGGVCFFRVKFLRELSWCCWCFRLPVLSVSIWGVKRAGGAVTHSTAHPSYPVCGFL